MARAPLAAEKLSASRGGPRGGAAWHDAEEPRRGGPSRTPCHASSQLPAPPRSEATPRAPHAASTRGCRDAARCVRDRENGTRRVSRRCEQHPAAPRRAGCGDSCSPASTWPSWSSCRTSIASGGACPTAARSFAASKEVTLSVDDIQPTSEVHQPGDYGTLVIPAWVAYGLGLIDVRPARVA